MSSDQQPNGPIAKEDNSDRLLGAFALLGSGVIGYFCIVAPLLAASRHESSVELSLKGIVVVPVLFSIGVINLVMGERARPILGRRQMPSSLGLIIYGVTFGLGFLLYLWLASRLRAYGYQI